jgi:hypothetical protein
MVAQNIGKEVEAEKEIVAGGPEPGAGEEAHRIIVIARDDELFVQDGNCNARDRFRVASIMLWGVTG